MTNIGKYGRGLGPNLKNIFNSDFNCSSTSREEKQIQDKKFRNKNPSCKLSPANYDVAHWYWLAMLTTTAHQRRFCWQPFCFSGVSFQLKTPTSDVKSVMNFQHFSDTFKKNILRQNMVLIFFHTIYVVGGRKIFEILRFLNIFTSGTIWSTTIFIQHGVFSYQTIFSAGL